MVLYIFHNESVFWGFTCYSVKKVKNVSKICRNMAKKTLKHEKWENFLKIKIKLKGQNTYSKIWILDFCKINIVETKKRVNFDCPEFHTRTWFWLMLYATVIWYKQFIWRDSVALDNNPCKISWSYFLKYCTIIVHTRT